jgi:hypothetical protein
MTLHDTRPRRNALVLACGVLSVGLTISCTGNIMNGDGSGAGPNNPPAGPPSVGGNGKPNENEILPPPPPGEQACETTQFTPARVWRLSDDQFIAAVKDLVPNVTVPTILTPGRSTQQFIDFAELFEIGPAATSQIRTSANAVATDAVKTLDALLGCKADDAGCTDKFIESFASRAFRRPLDTVEKDGLKAVFAAGSGVSKAEGIRMVISAVLQSGSFLYRTELGKGATVAAGQTVELTTHELASSLSFLLLNSIPDPALRAAADDGSLAQSATFKAQVERLLTLPRVQENLTVVYLKWMGLGSGLNADLAVQEKEFTPELKASMEQESKLFFKDLLGNGGTLTDVITSKKGFNDRVLGTLLGTGATGTDFSPVTYPAGQRSGALTLPGIVARYSLGHAEVFRGKFVRDEFLCEEIPPPPDLEAVEAESMASANLPVRQQSERRMMNGACNQCHLKMDPLGLSFGNIDALGRYRTTDKDGPINASGELSGTGDQDGPVKNVLELGDRLAKSTHVRNCIEGKMLGYALGRPADSGDKCELGKIDRFVTTGGGKLSDLMAAVVYSSAFRFRTGGN